MVENKLGENCVINSNIENDFNTFFMFESKIYQVIDFIKKSSGKIKSIRCKCYGDIIDENNNLNISYLEQCVF